MKLMRIITFLSLIESFSATKSPNGEWSLKNKIKIEQPLIYWKWVSTRPSKIVKQLRRYEKRKQKSIVLKTILSLELPLRSGPYILEEVTEMIFNNSKEEFDKVILLLPNLVDEEFGYFEAAMSPSDLNLAEFDSLFDDPEACKLLISLGEDLFEFYPPKFSNPYPLQKMFVSLPLKSGVVNGLLPYWNKPIIKNLSGQGFGRVLINKILRDPITQKWIFMSFYIQKSMPKVILTLIFSEKAERIYDIDDISDFKLLFTEDLPSWRQKVANEMDWGAIAWNRMRFYNVELVLKMAIKKETELFDYLVKCICNSPIDHARKVFNLKAGSGNFLDLYKLEMVNHEQQDFIYMKLEQKGYPIKETPKEVDHQLETIIWKHYLKQNNLGWYTQQIYKVMFYPHSKFLYCDFLDDAFSYFARNGGLREFTDLLSQLSLRLSNFLGGTIIFDFRVHHNGDTRKYYANRLTRIDLISDHLRIEGDISIMYPMVISKLKNEKNESTRHLLLKVLSHIVLKCINAGIPSIFHIFIFKIFQVPLKFDSRNPFRGWSLDIDDLMPNIEKIYSICDPFEIFLKELKEYFIKWEFNSTYCVYDPKSTHTKYFPEHVRIEKANKQARKFLTEIVNSTEEGLRNDMVNLFNKISTRKSWNPDIEMF